MILPKAPPRRIDLRVGEPFDNAGVSLKMAFDATFPLADLADDHSIQILRGVPRVS